MKIALNKCGCSKAILSISLDANGGGTRITTGKCCGRWEVVQDWELDANTCNDIQALMADALSDLEKDGDA